MRTVDITDEGHGIVVTEAELLGIPISMVSIEARRDPKPEPRVVNREVYRRFHRRGSPCVHCGDRRVSAAHILSKGARGDDVMANLVPLCGDGSSRCHGAYDNGHAYVDDLGRRVEPRQVRASVARYIHAAPETREYLARKLGVGGARSFIRRLEIGREGVPREEDM